MLRLESRPTDPVKLAKSVAVGVAVAVPLLLFGAPLIVQYQYAAASPGDRVVHPAAGLGTVQSVDGDQVTYRGDGGRVVTVSQAEIVEQ